MPEYLAPGVYVEETAATAKPIEGVTTSTCAFTGVPARIIIDKHVLPGATRIGAFGWFDGSRATPLGGRRESGATFTRSNGV